MLDVTTAAIGQKYEYVWRQWLSEWKEGHAEVVELKGAMKNRQRLSRVIIDISI